jgi:transposase-like protein
LVKQYERGGGTQRAFVEAHELSLATLQKWLREAREKASESSQPGKAPRWAEVSLPGLVPGPNWGAEVRLPNGSTVRFSESISPSLAQEILRALPC